MVLFRENLTGMMLCAVGTRLLIYRLIVCVVVVTLRLRLLLEGIVLRN